MPHQFIDQLQEGAPVQQFFLLRQVESRTDKTGKPYLSLVLGDKSGTIVGPGSGIKSWSNVPVPSPRGDYVGVQGQVDAYRGETPTDGELPQHRPGPGGPGQGPEGLRPRSRCTRPRPMTANNCGRSCANGRDPHRAAPCPTGPAPAGPLPGPAPGLPRGPPLSSPLPGRPAGAHLVRGPPYPGLTMRLSRPQSQPGPGRRHPPRPGQGQGDHQSHGAEAHRGRRFLGHIALGWEMVREDPGPRISRPHPPHSTTTHYPWPIRRGRNSAPPWCPRPGRRCWSMS